MTNHISIDQWLPVSAKEIELRGWDQPDVILFSGDAYVDHPAFGPAVVGRVLESMGLRVAIVPQPNWRDDLRDFKKLGAPRLFFGVTAGNMDSMVNHYTANKRLRSDDAYTPGGKSGFRPDYAASVYASILKKLFPEVPVVLGGIEASLRRLTHYDYWKDQLIPGILQWSDADLLVYGMGEQPLREMVRLLQKGVPFNHLTTIPQTALMQKADQPLQPHKKWESIELNSHQACLADKKKYAENFRHIEEESNRMDAARLLQVCGDQRIIVNPPFPPMTTRDMDASFDLPYTRLPHPRYQSRGSIPAYEMIKHSVILHRGCFGGCSFCTISAHQGKFIASRSQKSILAEVKKIAEAEDFKGYLSDLGGPSANMYRMQGIDLEICRKCRRPSCIHPSICKNLNTSHKPLLELYQEVDRQAGIKKSFIGSGVRYDLFMNPHATEAERKIEKEYANELITKHVSGRLKVAPEHTSDQVLTIMRKPSFSLFKRFNHLFESVNQKADLNQQLIPYFISSHPGSGEQEMTQLAIETKNLNFNLEQVQDFTPTPMTVATVIYYSGYHPYTLKPVYTARTKDEKQQQRMYFFWYKPEMRKTIEKRLIQLGLKDLKNQLFGFKPMSQKERASDSPPGGKKEERQSGHKGHKTKPFHKKEWQKKSFKGK